jgi:indolepyruvate ferredoxin oxidoreductase alpha subunit
MKLMGDMLLSKKPFSEIVMGNTALVRAMIEAGTKVITSYPGSPIPEIATAIKSIAKEIRPFYFEFSTNEKVATEIAFGAAVNGHFSTVFFKSVGLNVASDTFMQLSLMNIIGGMVIVLGDDPGANSSQNEQDNRHFAHMSYTPVLEPANPQEAYSFYLEAAKIAQKKHMPVILRLTTHVCHAKQRVAFGEYRPYLFDNTPKFNVKNGPYIPLTSLVFPKKERALKNITYVKSYAEKTDINYIVNNKNSKKGIITMGLPFLSLMDVLINAREKPDILKLGVIYPIPEKKIISFLKKYNEVKILEELDNILEKEVKAIAYDKGLSVKIYGKQDDDDWMGEYTPFKVEKVLQKVWPEIFQLKNIINRQLYEVPQRPAQMCPGCGHRSAFYAIKKALSDQDIKVADIGCHTLGYLPPYNMGELLMCMGASTAIGSGLSLYNDSRKVVVFMGDSTFFHAGMPGIVNAVFNNHHITMIIMENGTTAMTGHQDHAATGHNFNYPTEKIPIRKVLEGFGVKYIYETDTYDQKKLTELVKQAVNDKNFSVVIAKHPCMLKYNREQRRKPDYAARAVDIDKESCNLINNCIEKFACPTFLRKDNGEIKVNLDLCIGDGSCVQTCPSKAIEPPKKV